jgi:hypothetical protein
MLLQTNSYIVPKDRRSEHARLLRKFRQTLARLGCDQFEVYEQVGANWAGGEATGRFVQIMRFRDRKHQQEVQAGEKTDPAAQQLIQEFCALINFPYQQQQGLFAVGFYASTLGGGGDRRPSAQTSSPQQQSSPMPAQSGSSSSSSAAAAATAAGAAVASAAPTSETFELPESQPAAAEGASLLDFSALAPAAAGEERTPLRLTSEADVADEIIESEIAPPTDADAQPENSANGEHPDDALLEADDSPVSDADREAVLGELLEDERAEGRGQKAEG